VRERRGRRNVRKTTKARGARTKRKKVASTNIRNESILPPSLTHLLPLVMKRRNAERGRRYVNAIAG